MIRKVIGRCKLQTTIDENTDRIIDEMVYLGIHGTTKSEVASWIIRSWLWTNQEQLRTNGVGFVTRISAKEWKNGK